MFFAAFYKDTRPGVAGAYNRLVRGWEAGDYSHGEFIFSDGLAASASFEDKGIRFKEIEFSPEKWDFIRLPDHLEAPARKWFEENEFQPNGERTPYDTIGQFHFILSPYRGNQKAFWCTKAMAAAVSLTDPWRYGPNGLYSTLKLLSDSYGLESYTYNSQ